jgi:single-strand DNA-binding protein
MKNYKNNVQLIGNCIDPEFTILANDFKFVKFRIKTNEIYISQDGLKASDTSYHLCYAFGKQFDILERFIKPEGAVAIQGTLINRRLVIGDKETIETSIHISDLLIINN